MKSAEVLRTLRISRPTLTKYVKEGKIKVSRKVNNQYDYSADDVYRLVNKNRDRDICVYARVSVEDMDEMLRDQIDTVSKYCIASGLKVDSVISEIDTDTGDRKKFYNLVADIASGKIGALVTLNKYRLGRGSYKIVESLCLAHHVKLIYVDSSNETAKTYDILEVNADSKKYLCSYKATIDASSK